MTRAQNIKSGLLKVLLKTPLYFNNQNCALEQGGSIQKSKYTITKQRGMKEGGHTRQQQTNLHQPQGVCLFGMEVVNLQMSS